MVDRVVSQVSRVYYTKVPLLWRFTFEKDIERYLKDRFEDSATLYYRTRKIAGIGPGEMVVGINCRHHHAAEISDPDLPIVVIDKHTEMYGPPSEMASHSPTYRHYNWVFWELKKGRKVHLVLPPTEILELSEKDNWSYHCTSYVPSESAGSLNIYSAYDGDDKKMLLWGTGKGPNDIELDVKKIGRLQENVSDVRKQISIDMDYAHRRPLSEVADIVNSIRRDDDLLDVWLDCNERYKVSGELQKFDDLLELIGIV